MYLKVVADLGGLAEFVSRWSEGCRCHEAQLRVYLSLSSQDRRQVLSPCQCPMRSCRAPEFASGEALQKLGELAQQTKPRILGYLHEASSPAVATSLCSDWNKAIAYVMSLMCTKLHFWSELPYALCSLGHSDARVVSWLRIMTLASGLWLPIFLRNQRGWSGWSLKSGVEAGCSICLFKVNQTK